MMQTKTKTQAVAYAAHQTAKTNKRHYIYRTERGYRVLSGHSTIGSGRGEAFFPNGAKGLIGWTSACGVWTKW